MVLPERLAQATSTSITRNASMTSSSATNPRRTMR
jgi:hypothetical protein